MSTPASLKPPPTTTTTTMPTTSSAISIDRSASPVTGTASASDILLVKPEEEMVPAEERRPSIQFVTNMPDSRLPTGSPKSVGPDRRRRMTSPPPPASFQNRVSFDTFDNKDASDFSLTLNCKHNDYHYTRRSRTFLCGTDQNDYSEFALEWLIDELVDDGDEIVCLRVVDRDSKISSDASVAEGRYRTEAKKLLEEIIAKNHEGKAISLVLEFAVGKVHDTIQQMIRIYEPAILVVGTRGRSLGGIQGLLPGSVSKYCLQYSPVPVVVVRSTLKRQQKKKKREADPSRKHYQDILNKSEANTGHIVSNRSSIAEGTVVSPELEAEAVAEAIGLPLNFSKSVDPLALTRVHSTRRDSAISETASPTTTEASSDGQRSPGVVMQSPSLTKLESPAASESETSDEEDEGQGEEENITITQASLLPAHSEKLETGPGDGGTKPEAGEG
ncbi:MAG: hypothetical protein M1816_001074 [Peltula sp. TS41687]|nr:MAG: hypothetical protein M1816_001074 [Peltula sp. TS41687]